MTPLSEWNPYNFTHHGGSNGKPTAGGRNGNTPEKALDGKQFKQSFVPSILNLVNTVKSIVSIKFYYACILKLRII